METILFVRGRKIKISTAFITQSYFAVTKTISISSSHYVIIKR